MVDDLSSMTARIIRLLIKSYSTGVIDYAAFKYHIDKKMVFIRENLAYIKDIRVKIEVVHTLRLLDMTHRANILCTSMTTTGS